MKGVQSGKNRFEAKTSLREGLSRTIEWYRTHRESEQLFPNQNPKTAALS